MNKFCEINPHQLLARVVTLKSHEENFTANVLYRPH